MKLIYKQFEENVFDKIYSSLSENHYDAMMYLSHYMDSVYNITRFRITLEVVDDMLDELYENN
jgi:hypothetical protein